MSAGTIYTELDLDFSKFEKNQQKLLQSATSASLSIEKNFQNLGVKSDQIYEAMRRSAENSLEMIKAKSTSTGNEIARAQEAAAAKIKQINEEQFGKHNSLIDSIKANYVAMIAAAAAVYAAVIKPIEAYMVSETAMLKMGMAMKNQGDFTRAALVDMEEFSKEIQRTTAYEDDATLAIMANLKSFGMSNEEVKRATMVALDFATAKANEGMTVEKASEILGKSYLGITTGLKKLGIQIDEDATGAAVFNTVMEQLNQRFGGSAQAELLTYSGQWKQLKNQWGDVQEFLGLVFLKTIQAISVAFGTVGVVFWRVAEGIMVGLEQIFIPIEKLAKWAGFDTLAAGLESVRGGLGAAKDNFHDAAEAAIASTKSNAESFVSFDKVSTAIDAMGKAGQRTIAIDQEAIKMAKKLAQEKEAAEKAIVEAVRKAQIEIESIGLSQYDKDIARINSEVEKYRKAGVDKVTIAKFTEAEITLAAKKAAEEGKKLQEKSTIEFLIAQEKEIEAQGEAMKKEYEAEKKLAEDTKVLVSKSEEAFMEANYKRIMDEKKAGETIYQNNKKLSIERITIEAAMYADIKGYAVEHYDAQMALIAARAKAAKEAGVDEIAVNAWVAEEERKADLKRAIASDDFWDGLKLSMENYYAEEATAGRLGADIWQDIQNRKKGFSDEFVTNFIRGQDLMVSVQQAAGDMMIGLAGDISKKMWSKAIDKIIDLIGAHIGAGAAATGAEGATWGGVTGALTEIGTYLAVGVGAMLAGRGLAQGFKAQGGWIASHPMGGWIQEGSGARDDVFLGVTPGVRHWGMGGEFVVNKDSAFQFAPLLEAINQKHDGGGPIGGQEKWTGMADALVMGSAMSFLHGWLHGAGPISGVGEAIAFNATAIPMMFGGKYLQDRFRERGGWMDVGHGFFDWIPLPPAPWDWFGLPSPIEWDPAASLFHELQKLIPGSQYLPDPYTALSSMMDPDKLKGMILELIRTPYEQVAKDLITPGKFYSDPINVVGSLLDNFKDLVQKSMGIQVPIFDEGGTAKKTGLAFLEKGEQVIPLKGVRNSENNISELIGEVKGLRAEFKDLQRANKVIAKNTEKSARLMDRWEGAGMPATRTV